MKVSGFSFVRNAIKYDYPIVESINSILPICDEFVIAVGNSQDDTLQLIKNINSPKIKIIQTVWDESLREGGRVLALETDKAFQTVSPESDWAFYLQGDEIVHEKYLNAIYEQMEKWKNHSNVDGLLFKYKHFFGSYDYIGIASNWYPHEIRVIKNNKNIYSYRDAQGFRKYNNQKLNVKPLDAYIYHYGWVKHPKQMQNKIENFHKLWHTDEWIQNNVAKQEEFDYSGIDALSRFTETHPKVMIDRIKSRNWTFDFDLTRNNLSLKHRFKIILNKFLGIKIGYKNYRLV